MPISSRQIDESISIADFLPPILRINSFSDRLRDGQTNGIKFIPFVCPTSIPRYNHTVLPCSLASDRSSRRTDEWDNFFSIRLSVIYPYNHTALPRSLASDLCSRRTDEWNNFFSFVCLSSIPQSHRTPALARLGRICVRDGQTNGIKFIPFVCPSSIPQPHCAQLRSLASDHLLFSFVDR